MLFCLNFSILDECRDNMINDDEFRHLSVRVFSGLLFSGFSSFRAFEVFVRVLGRAFGLYYSSKMSKIRTDNAIYFSTSDMG